MSVFNFRDAVVTLSGTGGPPPTGGTALPHVRSVTINYGAEPLDVTQMGNTTKTNLAGLYEWSIDVTCLQDYDAANVDALLFPRLSYPYAPCAKASSVVSSTVLALATGYVGGTTSYSGGNDAATFEAGDVVELIERDTTTLWVEQLTVASVDTGLGRLTFTGAMSATAQTKIGAGWVDVRFADYAVCQASQQDEWMFVADDSTSVIDGTAEAQRLIAP